GRVGEHGLAAVGGRCVTPTACDRRRSAQVLRAGRRSNEQRKRRGISQSHDGQRLSLSTLAWSAASSAFSCSMSLLPAVPALAGFAPGFLPVKARLASSNIAMLRLAKSANMFPLNASFTA